jgi:hypothetical protein
VQVDATRNLVRLRGESPEISSSSRALFPVPADHGGMWRRGPQ